jgi:hypothetical protein
MANPLHFCLESLGQFTGGGPLILAGSLLDAILDICNADTEYQVRTAQQDAEEAHLKAVRELNKKFAAAAKAAAEENKAAMDEMVRMATILANELKRQKGMK